MIIKKTMGEDDRNAKGCDISTSGNDRTTIEDYSSTRGDVMIEPWERMIEPRRE